MRTAHFLFRSRVAFAKSNVRVKDNIITGGVPKLMLSVVFCCQPWDSSKLESQTEPKLNVKSV